MNSNKEVLILGAGGQGKIVYSILRLNSGSQNIVIKGFLDDDHRLWGSKVLGLPVLGKIGLVEELRKNNLNLACIVAIGENNARERVYNYVLSQGIPLVNAIHSSAVIDNSVKIGEGSVIAPGAIVNIDAFIGKNVIINTGVTIDHDCIIEDHVHIAPGNNLAGGVTVKRGSMLGVGVKVIPGKVLGSYCIIGAGSVVTEDIPDYSLAYGIPAKVMRRLR